VEIRYRKARYIKFIFVAIFFINGMGFAQGVYYWSQNYGTVSNLLGGQVIGSVRDVTATYYNPGYLGLVEEPELILGAKIFEYNDYKIDFDFIEDDEVSSGKLTSTHKFFYSYLIREKSDLRFDYKNIQNNPIENEYDTIVNEIFSLRKLSEIWVGVSWAFAPT
jgi:hypothetical protein